MSQDITGILNEWSFDPEANVRKIAGEDGVEKIQVRIDQGAFQGILQLNLDGRPDGRRPHGQDFALDHFRGTLEEHRCQHGTADEGFALDGEACKELFDEGARVYERYAFLLQLKDYQRVVRDTERNMVLFRFVNSYAEQQQDRDNLEKWWPYILRINGMAKAMLAVDDDDYDRALDIVHQTCDRIDSWPEVEAEQFYIERERSEAALEELEQELLQKRPLSHKEQLERSLQDAIDSEEFERAAVLRDVCPNLINYYGSTEGGGLSLLTPDAPPEAQSSVGLPQPRTEAEVVDENDRPLPAGEIGRVRYRGATVADSFHNDAQASAESFRDGWFYPGDLGRIDENGYLYLAGRAKDMIIRAGVNIYPEEVEQVLRSHPSVREAAVVGWASAARGEEVAAFIVTEGAGDDEALKRHCADSLAPYKVPRGIFFVDEMPRNAMGKIRKPDLAAGLPALED